MPEINPFSIKTDIKTESNQVDKALNICGPLDYEGYLSRGNNSLKETDSVNLNSKKELIPFAEKPEIKSGISGLDGKVADKDLEGMAQKGNNFSLFTHAESVAVNLPYTSAIVL